MILLVSCEKEDAIKEKRPLAIYTIPLNDTLPSIISENTTLIEGRRWYIKGITCVVNEATLHIDSGTIVRMIHQPTYQKDFPASGIIVFRGARIVAPGTRQYPIRFQIADSALHSKKAWNGIIVLGKAPSGNADISLNLSPWFNYGLGYGGNEPSDSSGVMTHVILERSGDVSAKRRFHSGIHLVSTGSRTVVKDVEVFINDTQAR